MSAEDLGEMSSKLHNVQIMTGDSFTMVRAAGIASGIEAWIVLHLRYHPTAPAFSLMEFKWVTSRSLLVSIEEWQVRVGAL